MLFVSLRNTLIAVATLCLVNVSFALPLLRNGEDSGLITREWDTVGASSLLGRDTILDTEVLTVRDLIDIYIRSPDALDLFEDILEARKNNPIKVSEKAKADIRAMLPAGHSRQDYKNAKAWHRNQIQATMTAKNAPVADIKRGVHTGGNNPNEPAHITAKLKDANNKIIQSKFKNANGNKRKSDTHHIPTSGNPPGVANIPSAR